MSDYISREAAMKAIKNCESADWFIMNWGLIKAMNAVGDIPAADVRPVVKSKWVDNRIAFYRGCPECGAFVRANLDEVFLRDFPSAVGRLNYCPNCGAKMEAEGGE